jgi:hypothetical protein
VFYFRVADAMTASPHDAAVSAVRSHVDDLAASLAVWQARQEPDAHARRCANEAIDAIDAMLRDLYLVRGRLVSEIRQADDQAAQRADDLLRHRGGDPPAPKTTA